MPFDGKGNGGLGGERLEFPDLKQLRSKIGNLRWIVLGLAAIALPIVGAIKALDGQYYRYPVIGSSP